MKMTVSGNVPNSIKELFFLHFCFILLYNFYYILKDSAELNALLRIDWYRRSDYRFCTFIHKLIRTIHRLIYTSVYVYEDKYFDIATP